MAIKTYTGKLYSLLNSCVPDNEDIEKRYAAEKLFDSIYYAELSECDTFGALFDEYFSKEKILSLPYEKYEDIERSAELIPVMTERLINAISYGNGWALTEADKPDFYNPESIKRLMKKLDFSDVYLNDTNITAENFMNVFSADKSEKNGYYCIKRTVSEVAYNEAW
ncbi:MAG: hypothetical protein ACI4KH_01640 [Oscillospiraceae bacterium]